LVLFTDSRRMHERELDDEHRALAELRLHANASAMLSYDAVGDRKPEPRSLPDALRRVERIEDPVDLIGCDSRSAVRDRCEEPLADTPRSERDSLRAHPTGNRLFGVRDEVEEHLLELERIRPCVGHVRIEIRVELDILYGEGVATKLECREHHVIDAGGGSLRRMLPCERQQVRHDLRGALR